MKLFSTKRNSINKQLICDDAVFDSDLIVTYHIDTEENVITFQYDFSECGHPLNLPFISNTATFLVKFTRYDLHICMFVEPDNNIDKQYEEYVGIFGEIEFDVRMTIDEKY